jgi:diguanylate cyclase (GGDEF)-like protein
MRLLDRNDATLIVALVASALVIFQRPLRLVIDAAHAIDVRYNIDLIPGLTVLVAAFAFHQYRKRHEAKIAEQVSASEAARERQRSAELERLVAFGTALSAALDPKAVRQMFWRYMPAFARDRELWLLVKNGDAWDAVSRDANFIDSRSGDALESVAKAALSWASPHDAHVEGVLIDHDICFPMTVADTAIGVVGVRNAPELSAAERRALSAAVELLASSLRNVQLMMQMHENSVRDPLTSCFNRAYALETLATELMRAKRSGQPISVLMFDVDRFKRLNDEYGHLAGDAVLAAVGAQMTRTLRAGDVKCRWGGDEFVVILPDTPMNGAEHAGGSLTREVSALRVQTPLGPVSPTISVGVAVAEPGECDPMALVGRADEALYKAKQTGRNRFVVARSLRAVNG